MLRNYFSCIQLSDSVTYAALELFKEQSFSNGFCSQSYLFSVTTHVLGPYFFQKRHPDHPGNVPYIFTENTDLFLTSGPPCFEF